MINKEVWEALYKELTNENVKLIAVSKTKPAADILELYNLGQRDFGENYVQELADKHEALPADINWHFIGHLQSNKVKFIAPFVHLIQTVDSFSLLTEINKQAVKAGRIINVLLQMYIAAEDTKFGLNETEILSLLDYYEAQLDNLQNVRICGLMGMATKTDNEEQVKAEFIKLHEYFLLLKDTNFFAKDYFSICSMGMSGDYRNAIAAGSNMVRIGSMLFGGR